MKKEEIRECAQEIGYIFTNKKRLVRALTRKGFFKEQKDIKQECENQETLSTLGDGVLGSIVVDRLWNQGCKTKDDITEKKKELVNNKTLSKIGKLLDLLDIIYKGGSEKKTETGKNTILADTVEALIGAIYLDGGYEITKKVVNNWYNKLNTLD